MAADLGCRQDKFEVGSVATRDDYRPSVEKSTSDSQHGADPSCHFIVLRHRYYDKSNQPASKKGGEVGENDSTSRAMVGANGLHFVVGRATVGGIQGWSKQYHLKRVAVGGGIEGSRDERSIVPIHGIVIRFRSWRQASVAIQKSSKL